MKYTSQGIDYLKRYKKIWVPIVILFIAYHFLFATMDVHYKLTITLNTPEGEVSGYAVREVKNSAFRYRLIDLPEAGNPPEISGEAVVVDMGARGVLFALIDTGSYMELFGPFPSKYAPARYKGINFYDSLKAGEQRDLSLRYWPKMVMFTDMDDARTVQPVFYKKYCSHLEYSEKKCSVKNGNYLVDNVEQYFGKNVSIKSVTVEITDESVTRGIRKYLSWLDNYYNQRLDGNRFGTAKSNYPVANQFAAGAFSTFRSGE